MIWECQSLCAPPPAFPYNQWPPPCLQAGQVDYRSMVRSYYRNVTGALAVYDVTSALSLEDLEPWIGEARQHASEALSIGLVGTKLDLCQADPARREVSAEDATEFMAKHGLDFRCETSAKTGQGVDDAFQQLVDLIVAKLKAGRVNDEEVEIRESIRLSHFPRNRRHHSSDAACSSSTCA
uniref:Uncharacterized protein n=1 Tax=Rhizochromulina marina TaxID=1034831 RepID=A0A7S2SDF8_9STRA|mmetsp:Transcript_2856/g.8153  ORF Transcript_2856/g.8153 Transcript_2856/m.8153 type:complete len:181 (+) Transcript_2856:292-834(+)